MECNKDEAAKAKSVAEKKLIEKDIAGAKKFALKAQSLFPGLEGLPQFMAILDVYVSSEKKINGEVDWYGILGVGPSDDDETLRTHYRKLALTLHPDKNKSVGADGAFKILSEAWSLLSDKAKRVEYDQKRNPRGINEKITTRNESMPAGKNGFHTSTHNNNFGLSNQNSSATPQPPTIPPRPPKRNTFWTACNRCNVQYEYLRHYCNHNIRCPTCKEPFYAKEIPAPPTADHNSSTLGPSYQRQENVNRDTINNTSVGGVSINGPKIQHHSFSVPGSALSSGQNANMFQPACQTLKRGRDEALTVAAGEEAAQRKIDASKKMAGKLATNAGFTSGKGDRPTKKSRIEVNANMGNGGVGQGNASGYQKGSSGTERLGSYGSVKQSKRELSQLEIRNLLMAKARMEIGKKLNEWRVEIALKASNNEGEKKREMEKTKVAVKGGKKDGSKNGAFVETKNPILPMKSSLPTSNVGSSEKAAASMLMNVPDSDFYDFDKDRIQKSFGESQVWAAYDDDDGMPRYYALIHKVVSKRPFKMQISWLNSKSNAELGPLNWIASGFPKTTGDFRVGKYEINKNLNSFSHRVNWIKGARGVIQIFPRKGDVWALYRNWSSDWNELTPDEVIHKYDVVGVLEDYNEERGGVAVAPLVKLAGFKSVFRQHLVPEEVKTIPREEMFRFSHSVPSYILTGQEARNAPKGCFELDPAAMPSELLQVVTETKEVEIVEKPKKVSKEDLDGVGKAKEDLGLEENCKGTAQEVFAVIAV
ncbi:hypothetical protein U1Q18_007063 [Sarracenia purpurea var. burkii]